MHTVNVSAEPLNMIPNVSASHLNLVPSVTAEPSNMAQSYLEDISNPLVELDTISTSVKRAVATTVQASTSREQSALFNYVPLFGQVLGFKTPKKKVAYTNQPVQLKDKGFGVPHTVMNTVRLQKKPKKK